MKKTLQDIYKQYEGRFGFEVKHIEPKIITGTKIIIVIPIHDEPCATIPLDSLKNCTPPDSPVEIILVVNNSEQASQTIRNQNAKSIEDIKRWVDINTDQHLTFHIMTEMRLPNKHAGVGLARKIGMDEALRRFASIGHDGLIVCLDADCTVKSNYLHELETQFAKPDFTAGNIYYEHPFHEDDEPTSLGIVQYELALRYYVNALRFAGYPYANHTVGSSMAVSATTYALSGGMNKRKAGEDFYFLHKLIPLGNFKELNSTTVYPSARISERVPFGTGRAMLKWKEQSASAQEEELLTYQFEIFQDLKKLIVRIPSLRTCIERKDYDLIITDLPDSVKYFLKNQNFYPALLSCIQQSTSNATFLKRIYTWFDGFRVLKFVHFSRDHFYTNASVEQCAIQLLETLEIGHVNGPIGLLRKYREIDAAR